MTTPTRREEENLWKRGFQNIVGLDEAGRGAWAGPIVAAAVILPQQFRLAGLRDSKQLTPKQRQKFFIFITKQAIAWSVGIVSQEVIDDIGIAAANKQAMIRALERLSAFYPEHLLIDALSIDFDLPQKAIIRGDQKVVSIAAASIVAKVTRDHILSQANREFPNYDFQQHKGYGTAQHRLMLRKHGVSEYHRKSFRPMKNLIAE